MIHTYRKVIERYHRTGADRPPQPTTCVSFSDRSQRRFSMSRSSSASAPKISNRSAWSRGPPGTSSASSRSQSPAPAAQTQPSHSRRPSTLGQGVSVQDGVSVPRNSVGVVKQGSTVTFGSIDDVSAPISSSPASAPPVKSEDVKTFGSLPNTHVNGKASLASRPAAGPSSSPAAAPAVSATPSKIKMDMHKFFQNPSQPSTSSTSADNPSPATRPSPLPLQSSSNQSNQPPPLASSHPPFTPFVPTSRPQQQNTGPGTGPPPRSPAYPRQLANGGGPRSQPGPGAGPSPGMSSPRLGTHPPAGMPPPPPPMPAQMQPQQMPVGWPAYYYPGVPDQQYMPPYHQNWYPMPQMLPPSQHQHPPHHPPSGPHGSGVPMSPRTHPPPLQGPGTPTMPHSATPIPHPPPLSHAPSSNMGGMSSPPPTPSSALPAGRLNANSTAFVPGGVAPPKKVTLKTVDGTEVNLEALKITPASSSSSAATARQALPATPTRKAGTVRIETPEQRQKRLEEEEQKEKCKAEAEEKVKDEERRKKEDERKKKEEDERKKKEEEGKKKEEEERKKREEEERKREEEERDRIRKEDEKKERLRKEEEEKERLRKEEEERLRKEEEEKERLRKEEERQRREEEDRKRKEEAERVRMEEEKVREEEERRKREEEERARKHQEEQDAAKAKAASEAAEPEVEKLSEIQVTDSSPTPEPEDGEIVLGNDDTKEKSRETLRINTTLSASEKKRPGPLDLTHSRQPSSPLTLARPLEDLGSVTYPAGIMSPRPELNAGAKEGKFRYDREFLLQFMVVCKEKPESLPPLDAIGLEPVDQLSLTRGGSGRHRQLSGTSAPSRQASISGSIAGPNLRTQYERMGQFAAPSSKFGPSAERFEAAGNRSVSMGGAAMPFRNPPLQRTASQGGPGGAMPNNRTRSRRGEKRTDITKGGVTGPQAHGPAYGHAQAGVHLSAFEPVIPLQLSENRWDRKMFATNDPDSPEVVDRKVKALLNKLTMEKFDSISDQIIQWANRSENQIDGRTLIQVIRLVFEKATDEATWSEMYARLCRKMMEQISPKVQDEGIKTSDGRPITGGQLFRKYLLNRCQEDFERGWVAKEAAAAAAASKAKEDQAIKDANENNSGGEVALYSEEYYIAQKAKRQGLGLIRFIGELFKLQMLTERIMHECIKKLLGNVQNPEEEEIESLCKLMTTIGALLDTAKAHAHMDVYFQRMKELTQSSNVSSRMQFMLQDVLELRGRKWIARNTATAPATLAQIHEAAAKEKAAQEKESSQRMTMSRGGSRRGGNREDFPQPDGWTVMSTSRATTRAGDLSQFGRISKTQQITTFGPSSVFAGKKDTKREPISRTNSSSNMFSMLQNSEAAQESKESHQRKKLMLQPRTKPVEEPTRATEESVSPSEEEAPTPLDMSEQAADAKIAEDVKEFFNIRNLDEAEVYFTTLSSQHHHRLVNKLVMSAVESKEPDARLVADLFTRANSKGLCSPDTFEEGLTPTAEIIEDIAIDAPMAWTLFAIMVKGAELDEEHRTRLASKSTDGDKLLGLLS
ncbi:hypothetical protein APHAL10511_004765 [Amanita phalloides]|nr:hypothetical protein APHAL10511_004765 [Amanita phalloides]